jgi:hypothetical protein
MTQNILVFNNLFSSFMIEEQSVEYKTSINRTSNEYFVKHGIECFTNTYGCNIYKDIENYEFYIADLNLVKQNLKHVTNLCNWEKIENDMYQKQLTQKYMEKELLNRQKQQHNGWDNKSEDTSLYTSNAPSVNNEHEYKDDKNDDVYPYEKELNAIHIYDWDSEYSIINLLTSKKDTNPKCILFLRKTNRLCQLPQNNEIYKDTYNINIVSDIYQLPIHHPYSKISCTEMEVNISTTTFHDLLNNGIEEHHHNGGRGLDKGKLDIYLTKIDDIMNTNSNTSNRDNSYHNKIKDKEYIELINLIKKPIDDNEIVSHNQERIDYLNRRCDWTSVFMHDKLSMYRELLYSGKLCVFVTYNRKQFHHPYIENGVMQTYENKMYEKQLKNKNKNKNKTKDLNHKNKSKTKTDLNK